MQGPSSFLNIVANTVIIAGTSGQLLVYDVSPPSTGHLIGSVTGQSVTDPYGNLALSGITSYVKRLVTPLGFWAGELNGFGMAIQNSTTQAGPWSIIGAFQYVVSTLAVGPATGLRMQNTISGAIITLPDGGASPFVQITGTAVASDPANGFVEQWHTVSLAAGWTQGSGDPLRYRLLPDGNVQLSGFATHTVITVTTQVSSGALPAAYIPNVAQDIPPAYVTSPALSGANVGTDGIIRCRSDGANTTTCSPQGIYPVN